MLLSDLVLFKNQLDKLSAVPIRDIANNSLNEITYISNTLSKQQQDICDAFDKFERNLNQLKVETQQQITEAEKVLFQQSYTLFEKFNGETTNTLEHLLGRRWQPDTNTKLFYSRLKLYVDWHHPALIFRPSYETFIDDMVGFDLLYLVDISHELLLPALSKFNAAYQKRLRSYTITEDIRQPILDRLPDNQFGLMFAYHYLNFRPFEILKKYLDEVYTKLKPGGTFIMTFNDCDRATAVRLVEKEASCYTPGYLVKELAQTIGYEIAYSWNDDGPQTWLELRKPGVLTSLKGGQTLAKIVSKPL